MKVSRKTAIILTELISRVPGYIKSIKREIIGRIVRKVAFWALFGIGTVAAIVLLVWWLI